MCNVHVLNLLLENHFLIRKKKKHDESPLRLRLKVYLIDSAGLEMQTKCGDVRRRLSVTDDSQGH